MLQQLAAQREMQIIDIKLLLARLVCLVTAHIQMLFRYSISSAQTLMDSLQRIQWLSSHTKIYSSQITHWSHRTSGDADERFSSKLKQSSCWVQNMPGTKKYNKINFKCINILFKNIWAKHSQKMLYTLVFFSTGDHEEGLCSVVEFPKLKIIYFTFGPFIDLIMEFGGCYLRSRPLKGTTWIPSGPPSLDTSTNFTISLEDRGVKRKQTIRESE